jgi:hypothetical protein
LYDDVLLLNFMCQATKMKFSRLVAFLLSFLLLDAALGERPRSGRASSVSLAGVHRESLGDHSSKARLSGAQADGASHEELSKHWAVEAFQIEGYKPGRQAAYDRVNQKLPAQRKAEYDLILKEVASEECVPKSASPEGKTSFTVLTAWRQNSLGATNSWEKLQTQPRAHDELLANFRCYTDRHGYGLKVVTEKDDPSHTLGLTKEEYDAGYWVKPHSILQQLRHAKSDWVFWLDADARFMRIGTPLDKFTTGLGKDVHVVVPWESGAECGFSAYALMIRRGHVGEQFVQRWMDNYRDSCGNNDKCPLWRTILEYFKHNATASEWQTWNKRARDNGPDAQFTESMKDRGAVCDGAAATHGITHFTLLAPKRAESGLALNCGRPCLESKCTDNFAGDLKSLVASAFIMHKPHEHDECNILVPALLKASDHALDRRGAHKKGVVISPGTALLSPLKRRRRRKLKTSLAGLNAGVLAAVREGSDVVVRTEAAMQRRKLEHNGTGKVGSSALELGGLSDRSALDSASPYDPTGDAGAVEIHNDHAAEGSDHGAGHGHDVDPVDQAVGQCMGWMLVCVLLFGMGGVYTVTFPDPQVYSYTMKALFQIVSIFVALLYVMIQEAVVLRLVHETLGAQAVPVAVFLLFLMWYGAMSWFCCAEWGDEYDLHALMGIVSHVAAFTALHPLMHLLDAVAESVEESHGFGAVCLWFAVAPFLLLMAMWVLRGIAVKWRHDRCHDHERLEVTGEAEGEATAILVGKLLSQFVVAVATAQVPPHDCSSHFCNHSTHATCVMGLACIAGIVVLLRVSDFNEKFGDEENDAELIDLAVPTSAFFVIWTVQTAGSYFWETGLPGGEAGSEVIHAALFTPLIVLVIIAIDRLADTGKIDSKAADAVLGSLGLLIGLQWEMAFHAGVHVAVGSVDAVPHVALECVLAVVIIAALVPAWRWYIVPTAAHPVPSRDPGQAGTASHGAAQHGAAPRASKSSAPRSSIQTGEATPAVPAAAASPNTEAVPPPA